MVSEFRLLHTANRFMTTDYSAISQYNEEQLGKDRKSRMSQVAMYAIATHFVYELLQNADDKDATEICFTLTRLGLVVEHNGTPFSEQNVRAITYFGKGNTDITKIGHFGLGFKSVFAYTASPEIHSGIENFEINDLYKVAAIPHPSDLSEGRTRFVLPFNHLEIEPDYIDRRELKSPDTAYEEIASKLADLGATTLLFTRELRKIQWKTDDEEGAYIREDARFDDAIQTTITTNDNSRNFYLVYGQAIQLPDDNGKNQTQGLVQLAFEIDKPLAESGRIKPIRNAKLNVFFPTDKETYVGFIIQGPYRTTPSRDNVLDEDDFNRYLIEETAKLIITTLERLKDLQLLSLDVLDLLPIDNCRYPPKSLFLPLYTKTREALFTRLLLPTASSGFVAAKLAKIADSEWLTRAFPLTQLEGIFATEGLRWLPIELTQNKYRALYGLLAGQPGMPPLVPNIVVRPETIAGKLTASFITKQSDEWLISFYKILHEKRASKLFQGVPYLRLSDDSLVPPPNDTSSPNVFLPYDNETACMDFSVIKRSLVENENALDFFVTTLKLTKPDPVDVLCKKIGRAHV